MRSKSKFKVVDLFAGPGGLGEGFSSLEQFDIAVSAEMDASAHMTLRLRAFYRSLRQLGGSAMRPYFDICNGLDTPPKGDEPLNKWDERTKMAWSHACKEALKLTLGEPKDNERLDAAIRAARISPSTPWVLIGGPPCQAYSLVGRARNKGKAHYEPEQDHRHYLYREYLRIISKYKPHVFVMENVKGILSSKVGDQQIFHQILTDLSEPDAALNSYRSRRGKYRIYSLVSDMVFAPGDDPRNIDANNFIVRAEEYGIPQARHRVILVGVREDVAANEGDVRSSIILKRKPSVTVQDVISDLPKLRSKLSKMTDGGTEWELVVADHAKDLANLASKSKDFRDLSDTFSSVATKISGRLSTCSEKARSSGRISPLIPPDLDRWYRSSGAVAKIEKHLNHESRGHMTSDLRRYLYAAVYAAVRKSSPKGHEAFSLKGLRPLHENWDTGKFSDRFRVQLKDRPATTITSHISKDGHYFIHPDPVQCRSLTVREAARLQTFPDDYYFQGNRTQQYHQVGNAVPPHLAKKIAEKVLILLGEGG